MADTYSLPVMESFYTIQGEGFHQGKAAYFIRIAGCDVGCVWCDVKESWKAENHPVVTTDQLVEQAQVYDSKMVVITGGEPLMYNLDRLTGKLQKNGFRTHLETSGAYRLSGDWNWICVSPKKFKVPTKESLKKADELKVIVYNKSDFKWAESFEKEIQPDCKRLLQPEWSKQKEMIPFIIEYVKKQPHWGISLQTHKFMDIP